MTMIVVGSGLAGVAAAHALLKQGKEVLMLDVGKELPREATALLAEASSQSYPFADPGLAARLKGAAVLDARGVPEKRLHGTTVAFDGAAEGLALDAQGTALKPSFARGGLSNVWGAAVLPFPMAALRDWPVTWGELAPHYKALHEFLPVAAADDGLTSLFPLFGGEGPAAPAGRQAKNLLARLDERRGPLEAKGVRHGAARLAMRGTLCRSCGHCMAGCPFNLIYASKETLDRLQSHAGFTYVPGQIVEGARESATTVTVTTRDEGTGERRQFAGERLFLAAGVFGTTRIALQSLGAANTPVTVRDSQYFLFPLWSAQGAAGVRNERLHTLSQVFLELDVPEVSPDPVHVQLYTYNDYLEASLQARAGLAWNLLGPGRDFVLGRLWVAQAYLPSARSGTVELTLGRGEHAKLTARGHRPDDVLANVRRALARLAAAARHTGLRPLSPLLQLGEPGQGFHAGAQFPMRLSPGDLETDALGRFGRMPRMHLVDASVLPDVPSAPISYTVMANAHRIATEAAKL